MERRSRIVAMSGSLQVADERRIEVMQILGVGLSGEPARAHRPSQVQVDQDERCGKCCNYHQGEN